MKWPVGGKRLTGDERAEIRRLFLSGDPVMANSLAALHGLSPRYAYKLAHESGQLPTLHSLRPAPETKPADMIIDRSPAQKEARLIKIRAELLELGYSVVKTEWLHAVIGSETPAMEAAE